MTEIKMVNTHDSREKASKSNFSATATALKTKYVCAFDRKRKII